MPGCEGARTALKAKEGELWPEDSPGDAYLPKGVYSPPTPALRGCSRHGHPKLQAVRPAPGRGREGDDRVGGGQGRRGPVIRRDLRGIRRHGDGG